VSTGFGEEIGLPGGVSGGGKSEKREGEQGFIGEGSREPLGGLGRSGGEGDSGRNMARGAVLR
jgi:hypothetical protein